MRTWLPLPLHDPVAAGWGVVTSGRAICSSCCPTALPRRGGQRAGAVEEDVLQLQRGGVLALQQLCRHTLRWHQCCGDIVNLLAVMCSSCSKEECLPFSTEECLPFSSSAGTGHNGISSVATLSTCLQCLKGPPELGRSAPPPAALQQP